MAKNKTIAFFNGVYLPHLGGVERYTFELASRLKKDYNVIIVTANTENLPAEADEGGIKVFRLPVKNLPKNKRLPFLKKNEVYKKLVEKIENLDIDQIVCNTRFYETTLLGCKIAQKKHITPWVINHSGGYVLKPYEDYITKKVLKYRPKFYAVSKTSSKFLKNEYGVETANIFYNAISRAKDFKKPENKTVKILYAGRLIKGKGLEKLLKAFELVKNKCDVELIIAGDGPLKKLIKDDKKIKFLGYTKHDELMQLFRKIDIFAFPTSYPEGFPTVVLEAGINKCAVIASGIDANEEMLGRRSAIIVKNDNKTIVKDLAAAIEKVANDSKYRKKLQDDLFRRVNEKYTCEETVKTFKQEIKNV
jgi:glycosyltransferase involved in cell wall biosynthesis